MAESFGVEGRGAFTTPSGAIRDVVQNHLLQVVAYLAMEPPLTTYPESIRDEKVKVFRSILPLDPDDLVRGQFSGYRKEPGVAAGLDGRDLRRRAAAYRFLAMGGRAVLHPRRQVSAGDRHRGAGHAQAAAAAQAQSGGHELLIVSG